VDYEKQSPPGFSDAAQAAAVDNRGAAVSESSYRLIIGATSRR